jgi:hypothetical protein
MLYNYFVAILLQKTVIITIVLKECVFNIINLTLNVITINDHHLLMPAALTLLDYLYLCLWLVKNNYINNKNPIN